MYKRQRLQTFKEHLRYLIKLKPYFSKSLRMPSKSRTRLAFVINLDMLNMELIMSWTNFSLLGNMLILSYVSKLNSAWNNGSRIASMHCLSSSMKRFTSLRINWSKLAPRKAMDKLRKLPNKFICSFAKCNCFSRSAFFELFKLNEFVDSLKTE